jgi:hypothetical protein
MFIYNLNQFLSICQNTVILKYKVARSIGIHNPQSMSYISLITLVVLLYGYQQFGH